MKTAKRKIIDPEHREKQKITRAFKQKLNYEFQKIGKHYLDPKPFPPFIDTYIQVRNAAHIDFENRRSNFHRKLKFKFPVPGGYYIDVEYCCSRYSGIKLIPPKSNTAAWSALQLH